MPGIKRTAWNKGLTKETDGRVRKYVENGSGRKKGSEAWNKGLVGYGKNFTHTPEWNNKVSLGLKAYYSDKLKPTRQGKLGRAWVSGVMARDSGICRVCGKPATIAHHICLREDFPRAALEPWNGVAVCKPCHNRIHHITSYPGEAKLWVISSEDVSLFFASSS